MPAGGRYSLPRLELDRRVGEDLVLLGLRFVLVLGLDVLDRAFAGERARQDHDANEAARPVLGGLREHRIRAGLVPSAAGSIRRRAAARIDADAAFDHAADAGSLMHVRESAATGREGDAVAAHQQFALRHGFEKRRELLVAAHAGRAGGGRPGIPPRQLPAPAGYAVRPRPDQRLALALPAFAGLQSFV